jgi:serine/threonine protein kinase
MLAGYRIEAMRGGGGMGVVYRATRMADGREVALKVIAPQFADDDYFRSRFEREARLAAQLRHPHAVGVEEAGEADGRVFLAMPFVDGTDLEALIASSGGLPPPLVARVTAQVGSALAAAHALGLVHRDVKLANVLVESRDGYAHAYLTDFGLTKHVGSTSGLTKTGIWVGTVDYAAPEQIQGGAVDARADVYALGCVLYHALTGEVPYPRRRDVSKIMAHLSEPPPAPTAAAGDVPSGFDEVVARAMAKDPRDRYQSATKLGDAALAAASVDGPVRFEKPAAAARSADPPLADPGAPTVA